MGLQKNIEKFYSISFTVLNCEKIQCFFKSLVSQKYYIFFLRTTNKRKLKSLSRIVCLIFMNVLIVRLKFKALFLNIYTHIHSCFCVWQEHNRPAHIITLSFPWHVYLYVYILLHTHICKPSTHLHSITCYMSAVGVSKFPPPYIDVCMCCTRVYLV